jgi:Zn-dependent M28 family amino/carboxypeptidase
MLLRISSFVLLSLTTWAAAGYAQRPAQTAPQPAAGKAAPAGALMAPPAFDPRLYEIASAPSAERIERDIRKLVSFGTRHTLSDTVSQTRGIGAARRWLKAEFDAISKACGGCLEVVYQRNLVKAGPGSRYPVDTWVVNVLAIQRGTSHPNNYVIMSGDIDSRVSDVLDGKSESPGANDNSSGVAGTLEAARVLSRYRFPKTIVYAQLSGEEQGLTGGQHLAQLALDEGWTVEAVLNNDMIGNIEGINGTIDNRTFRIFSEPTKYTETDRERAARRTTGGEVDGPSRQVARYVERVTRQYLPELNPRMIYRLDRFGRGGHHRPFNDLGFPGIRIMEMNEHYHRQHQDLRTEGGIAYGDVIEGVDFEYAAKLTGVNAITLAALASAPPAPEGVRIRGAVSPSTTLSWSRVDSPELLGYRIYWRDTTEPQWTTSRFVGNITEYVLENVVIDNFFFGVAAVGKDGNESAVIFPGSAPRPAPASQPVSSR